MQLVNDNYISKWVIIELIYSHFPNKCREITARSIPASNKLFLNIREDLTFELPTYAVMIVELRNWMEKYSALNGFYLSEKS